MDDDTHRFTNFQDELMQNMKNPDYASAYLQSAANDSTSELLHAFLEIARAYEASEIVATVERVISEAGEVRDSKSESVNRVTDERVAEIAENMRYATEHMWAWDRSLRRLSCDDILALTEEIRERREAEREE